MRIPIISTIRKLLSPRPPTPPTAPSSGVTPEILRQVRLIELRTRGWVESLFGGEYHSIFRGQGIEFMEVREYQPGDDIRNIDWNVTARIGTPFVKKHIEERELTVILLIDLSASGHFGTVGRLKAELAAEIAAVLALSAVRNNDRVGLLIFTDQIEHFVPPRKGQRHVLRLIRDILAFNPESRGTDLAGALDYTGRVLRQRAVIFLISDFLEPGDPEIDQEIGTRAERTLSIISKRHDLIAISIRDTAEEVLPNVGLLAVTDPETGLQWTIDTSDPRYQTLYADEALAERDALKQTFRRLGIDEIEVRTGESYVKPLLAFFQKRDRIRVR